MIDPVNGRLLVELRSKFKHVQTTAQQFGDSKTRGYVRAIAKGSLDECKKLGIKVGDVVYFGAYEDTAKYPIDGKDYILIKLEDVAGREDA